MKTVIIILVVVATVVAFFSFKLPIVDFKHDPQGGIQFHKGSFDEALRIAKKENKLVFLDIYAVWCGPCKRLKTKTFSNNEVGDFFNSSFVNVSLDGEEQEGSELAVKYGVQGYPTLLFISGDGNVVAKASGYHNANELIRLGKSAINQIKK